MAAPPIVWTPSPERVATAAMTRFREWVNERHGLELADYHDLWRWSVDELDGFWAAIWEFFAVEASEPYERVLGRRQMPGAEWFPGARLSYAQHAFRNRDDGEVAIRHASELRPL
ncbi:MAG TPA: acetyl-coenzyme A synthetase N-terminal domain-containing protein, partial [Gaiellaceae bacterium]|nr:acetyl-coenzyme A synthetase N-terminal domain-containing protein [Gaiellaceae bacterium]